MNGMTSDRGKNRVPRLLFLVPSLSLCRYSRAGAVSGERVQDSSTGEITLTEYSEGTVGGRPKKGGW